MSEKQIAGPQGQLTVTDLGTGGLPVVFVHSDAGQRGDWAETVVHLSPARRTVALDLRGHGDSAEPEDGDYSVEGRAEDILAVADGLGLVRFILVGHSGGGAVALSFAGAYPERVAGLLLVDPVTDGRQVPREVLEPYLKALDTPQYLEALRTRYASIVGRNEWTRERVLGQLSLSQTATQGVTRALLAFNPTQALRAYQGPQRSIVTPPNDTPAAYHRLKPELPHQVIEGTGHWLYLDKPAEFKSILGRFIAEVETIKPVSRSGQEKS